MRRLALLGAALLLVSGSGRLFAQANLPPEVAKQGYADEIVVNAHIISVDDGGLNENPGHIYEAMAIKNHRIQALGTNDRSRTLANADTKVLDAKGMTVLPGIVESHVHIFGDARIAAQMGITSPGQFVSVEASKDMEGTRLKVENAIKDAVGKSKPGEVV